MTPRPVNKDFHCIRCGNPISVQQVVSGVNNRNHCPYCLWSRHMDLYIAGDRLSACKAPMRPVGLSMKPAHNKYAATGGELMLVHACVDCGRISINRIASDDDADHIFEVYSASLLLPAASLHLLQEYGIRLLGKADSRFLLQQVPEGCLLVSV